MLQIMCAWPSFCLCVTQFCAHIFVYIFLNSMVLCVLSPQLQKCSQSCAYVQQASWKNLLKTSLHKYYLRLHNCIPNCSIMIYIHTDPALCNDIHPSLLLRIPGRDHSYLRSCKYLQGLRRERREGSSSESDLDLDTEKAATTSTPRPAKQRQVHTCNRYNLLSSDVSL